MLPQISREKQLGILRKMLMIRRAEEHVIRFNEDYEGLIRERLKFLPRESRTEEEPQWAAS